MLSIFLENADSITEIIDVCRKSMTIQRMLSIFLKHADSTTKTIDLLLKQRRPESDFDDPLSKNNDFGTRPGIAGIAGIAGNPRKRWQQLRPRPPLTHAPGARMTVVKQTPSN